jgi:glycerol-3-phosphate acyltransferase PlsY
LSKFEVVVKGRSLIVLLLQYAAVILVGYLLGSIPTGYIIGRIKGVNVLEHGSGRIGGTNVLRSVGLWAAALTGAGDVAKGALAVLIGRVFLGTELAAALGGIAAVIGHNWSIYIGFRGGAGTATYMGGFVMLSLIPTVIVGLGSFIIGFALRYASVASILISVLMAPALLIGVLFFNQPVEHLAYALVVGAIILFSHRPNIRRLLKGTERRLGEPAKKIGEEEL